MWRLPVPSGVVKWLARERRWSGIARVGGGDAAARSSAVRDDAERERAAGERVSFDARDTAGDRAETTERPGPGCGEPAESPETDQGDHERLAWPVQAVFDGDAVDTCPWCVHMREADAAERRTRARASRHQGS